MLEFFVTVVAKLFDPIALLGYFAAGFVRQR
jgi:hypothetical protein